MFYSFGWRLLLCQHETLSSKSVVFFVWKPLKYYNALSLRTLYEEVLLTKATIYILPTSFARGFRINVSNLQFVWNQIYIYKIWRHLLLWALSLTFLPFGVFLLRFLCFVYPLVNSLYWVGVRKIGSYKTILFSNLCWDLLDKVFLAFL